MFINSNEADIHVLVIILLLAFVPVSMNTPWVYWAEQSIHSCWYTPLHKYDQFLSLPQWKLFYWSSQINGQHHCGCMHLLYTYLWTSIILPVSSGILFSLDCSLKKLVICYLALGFNDVQNVSRAWWVGVLVCALEIL